MTIVGNPNEEAGIGLMQQTASVPAALYVQWWYTLYVQWYTLYVQWYIVIYQFFMQRRMFTIKNVLQKLRIRFNNSVCNISKQVLLKTKAGWVQNKKLAVVDGNVFIQNKKVPVCKL